MALANDSLPGQALFYALLAISSLRRNGLRQEAVHFKVSSLQALSKSARAGSLGPAEAAQHVATCMLLCAFEVSSGGPTVCVICADNSCKDTVTVR